MLPVVRSYSGILVSIVVRNPLGNIYGIVLLAVPSNQIDLCDWSLKEVKMHDVCFIQALLFAVKLTLAMHTNEQAHTKGTVMVRYNPTGTHFASVGTDKSLCLHHGTTMELLYTLPNLHKATIYTCAWNHTKTNEDSQILTCSADGTIKVTSVNFNDTAHPFKLLHTFSTNTTSVVGPSSSPSTTKTTRLPIGLMQMSCAFLQKNNDIVSVSLNGQISIWDKNNDDDNALSHNGPKLVLSGHQASIAAMAICNNNIAFKNSRHQNQQTMWMII